MDFLLIYWFPTQNVIGTHPSQISSTHFSSIKGGNSQSLQQYYLVPSYEFGEKKKIFCKFSKPEPHPVSWINYRYWRSTLGETEKPSSWGSGQPHPQRVENSWIQQIKPVSLNNEVFHWSESQQAWIFYLYIIPFFSKFLSSINQFLLIHACMSCVWLLYVYYVYI